MANIVKFIRAGILTRHLRSTLCTSVRSESNKISSNLHKVNDWEKRFLVWTGKFKSVEEVPAMVAAEAVEKARNRMRIRIANGMMLATLIACLFVSISGKRAAQRGESVLKQNLEWHKQLKEDAAAAAAAQEKAEAESAS